MNYWLLKSEPAVWSWQQQCAAGTTHWDGVRNYQARNYMQAMRLGDLAFFYHSNEGKEIVGIVTLVREYYPDPEQPDFGMVDVAAAQSLKTPITLAQMKADSRFDNFLLLRQPRLSVMPVEKDVWEYILSIAL
ncbi:MAG: EVE domain-containing protein [Alphaproteobacteria bacterium]